MLILSLLLSTSLLQCYVSGKEVATCLCVKPTDNMDQYNPCLSGECQPLMYYANHQSSFANDTIVKFLPGIHTLYETYISVKKAHNLSLTASVEMQNQVSLTHRPLVQCIGSNTGFLFEDTVKLTITGLGFQNCGFQHYRNYSQALLLRYVIDLQISNVLINNASGYGLYILNLEGNSVIQQVVINASHNTTGCFAGNINILYDETGRNDSHYLVIRDSTFSNGSILTASSTCRHAKSYASGLGLLLATTNRIDFTLRNVTLTGNKGRNGANLAITYIHTPMATTWFSRVTIDNCTLSFGKALLGGGLYLQMIARQYKKYANESHPPVDVISINDTRFDNNTAEVVGGGAYFVLYEEVTLSTGANINIDNSTFVNNAVEQFASGHGGVALNIFNFQVAGYLPHKMPQFIVSVTSCYFMFNRVTVLKVDNSVGSGTIYVEESAVTNLRDNEVSHNKGTGVVAIRSNLVLEGSNTIFNNTGNNGGGLVLCDNSVVYLTGSAILIISQNTALSFGGGIYAEFDCTQAIPPCFFQFNSTRTAYKKIFLDKNVASIAGSALYGGSVEYCFFFGYNNPHNSTEVFFNLFSITKDHSNDSSYITSNPLRVCFCSEDSEGNLFPNCSELVREKDMYPGGMLTVPLVAVGQRDGPVPGVVIASNVTTEEATQSINTNSCKNLIYFLSSKAIHNARESHIVNISLTVQNVDFREANSSEYVTIISVYLTDCPLGFELQDNNCTDNHCGCHCLPELQHLDNIECDIKRTTIYKKRYSQSWLGFITHNQTSEIVFANYCPFDYCNETVKHALNVSPPIKGDNQCAYNRSGLLCGGCRDNLSQVFGSSRCSDCSNYNALNVIGLVVLFAMLGLGLILFLEVVDMTVTEGTLNSVIFYMNVVCVNRSSFFGHSQTPVIKVLMVFVSWMNLDLGIDTCFYSGMTAFDKAVFQFIFPLYLWILAGIIIILCRKSINISMFFGKSAIKVLATIVLLSYAKLFRAAIDALYQSRLTYTNSSGTHRYYSSVWRIDGNIPYWGTKHALLLALAVVVAAVTLPYTLALLFIQCLRKRSDMKVLFWVNKLKPFFDAYTGPYKDKYHFWTGFLLIARIVIFIGIATNSYGGPTLNLTLIGTTTSLLCLFIQPGIYYRKYPLNAIEMFTYVNLTIYSFGTAYVISLQTTTTVPTALCVGSMFLLFCGVMVYHIAKRTSETQRWRLMRVWLLDKKWPWMKRKPIRSLILPYIDPDSVDELSSSDNELDPILQNAPPVARYDEYREPLINTTCSD